MSLVEGKVISEEKAERGIYARSYTKILSNKLKISLEESHTYRPKKKIACP